MIAFQNALLALDRVRVGEMLAARARGGDAVGALESLVVPALERIGAAWEAGRLALSQVYMSGRLCEEVVDAFLPPAAAARPPHVPTAIAVLDDYHMLGKRMVYSALRASGFAVRDYGRGDVDDLVRRVADDGIGVLLVSVLMLHSALRVRDLRARLAALSTPVRVVVGGAPFRFDDCLWTEVGADAMGRTAADAIRLVRRFAVEEAGVP